MRVLRRTRLRASQEYIRLWPRGMTLVIRVNAKTGMKSIGDPRESGVSHQDQPCFVRESIFANGNLCMGWEDDTLTIRRVTD